MRGDRQPAQVGSRSSAENQPAGEWHISCKDGDSIPDRVGTLSYRHWRKMLTKDRPMALLALFLFVVYLVVSRLNAQAER